MGGVKKTAGTIRALSHIISSSTDLKPGRFSPGNAGLSERIIDVARYIADQVVGIEARDLGYAEKAISLQPHTVAYRPLVDSQFCTIGVFEFGRGAQLALHDHCGAVVSLLIAGNADIVSFDLDPHEDQKRDLNLFAPVGGLFTARTRLNTSPGSRSWMTLPHRSAIHSIRASPADHGEDNACSGGCVILDVVVPPYSGLRHDVSTRRTIAAARSCRDDGLCTFYEVAGWSDGFAFADSLGPNASLPAPCTLRPLRHPGKDAECEVHSGPPLPIQIELGLQ